MNRIVVWALFPVLLSLMACTSDASTPKGPVKTETRFNAKDEMVRKVFYLPNGKVSREESYYSSGGLMDAVIYSYRDTLLSERLDSADRERHIYRYDELGRRISEAIVSPVDTVFESCWYSEDGRLKIDSSGYTDYVGLWTLDDRGKPVAWARLNAAGDTVARSLSAYDDMGRETDYRSWENGAFFRHQHNVFGLNGKKSEEFHLLENGDVKQKYVYTYDDQERIVRIDRLDEQSNSDFAILYTYDGNTRITHTEIPGLPVKTTREVYSYYPVE